MSTSYDVIIVGGGPAGLTAGLYTSRAKLKTLLLDGSVYGGRLMNLELVENYPGFSEGVSGPKLAQEMMLQTLKYGTEFQLAQVTGVTLATELKVVRSSQGDREAPAVIIAGGCELKTLGVPGEEKFLGRGVSHCAMCDGAFFADQPVAVVGGGDSAVEEALFLTRFASKVTIIHRRELLRACKAFQEKAFSNPKIDFVWNSVVEEVEGDDQVKQLRLREVRTGEPSALEVAGVFVYIGLKPNTNYLEGLLPLDNEGYILTNERMETAIPGVFVAGDIRSKHIKQIVSATAEGAAAALSAVDYLARLRR